MKKIFCRMVSVILLISSVSVGVKADHGFGTDWDLEREYERISQQKDIEMVYLGIASIHGREQDMWTQRAFQVLGEFAQREEIQKKKAVEYLKRMEYPDVDHVVIDCSEAYALAAKELGFSTYSQWGAVLISDSPNPVWKVCIDDTYFAEVDCVYGEIKELYEAVGEYRSWFGRMTLKEVIDIIEGLWKDVPSKG